MKFSKYVVVLLFGAFLAAACSDNSTRPDGGQGSSQNHDLGNGIIFYDWSSDGIQKIDLESGIKSTVLPEDLGRYGWDVSLGGESILQSAESPDQDYDANQYTLTSIKDDRIISQFKYYPTDGDLTNGYLSPDGKFLLVGTEYQVTGPFGHIWYLKIVPLDGQTHNVNEGADSAVIPVIAKGDDEKESASGNVEWR